MLGITINVDLQQVTRARREIEAVNGLLNTMGNSEFSIGSESMAKDLEHLRQVSLDLTRLANLSRTGEAGAGFLNLQQFRDAAVLSKRVGDNLGQWIQQSQKLRSELKGINEDLEGLQKASLDTSLSAGTRNQILTEISSLQARRQEIEAELKAREKGDVKATTYRERAEEYMGNISGYGMKRETERVTSAIGGMMRTLLGVAGGVGIGAFIGQSIHKYVEADKASADLGAIGVGVPGNAGTDYLFSERAQVATALARSTGYGNAGLSQTAMSLARGRGVSADAYTGFMGGVHRATGMGGDQLAGYTAGVSSMTKNSKRQVEVLEGIEKILQHQMRQQGGTVSEGQAAFWGSLFTKNFDKDMVMQTADLYTKVSAAMAQGGKNPVEQLLHWKFAGIDEWDGTMAGLEKIYQAKNNTLGDGGYRKRAGGWFNDKGVDPTTQRMRAHLMYGLGLGAGDDHGEAGSFVEDIIGAGDGADLKKAMNDRKVAAANTAAVAGNYRGSEGRRHELEMEGSQIRAGRVLAEPIHKLQEGLTEIGTKFVEAISRIHSVEDVFREGTGFVKESVKELWNSGPLGKMVTVLGGIYIAVKTLALKAPKGALAETINGLAGGALAGGGGRALLSRMAGTALKLGARGAAVGAFVDTMYGELDSTDDKKAIQQWEARQKAGGNAPSAASQQGGNDGGLTDVILTDIFNLIRSAVSGPARPGVAPVPAASGY